MSEDQSQAVQMPKLAARNPAVPLMYVEGISQMAIGFPNSRVVFNSFSQRSGEGAGAEEMHQLACELVVPTAALIEIARTILGQLAENRDLLRNLGSEWMERVNALVADLPPHG
jgi:hypothetical protein